MSSMLRMTGITGLIAVLHGTGRRLGVVERVCLSADGQDVQGLILRKKGFVRRKVYVPFECIALWGEKTVAVTAEQKIPLMIRKRQEIEGMSVLDTAGERLGWVTDALVEESAGRVRALEVSRGYVDDFTAGRAYVRDFTMRLDGVVAVKEDAAGEADEAPAARSR